MEYEHDSLTNAVREKQKQKYVINDVRMYTCLRNFGREAERHKVTPRKQRMTQRC